MSTTLTKRPLAEAVRDAEAFRSLFSPSCYSAWEFAGSVRRQRLEVADIEHVVAPKHGEIEDGSGLFTVKRMVNLLWHHLDALVARGEVTKHIYGGAGYRWGPLYRGADFRGFNHELFTADASENWGPILAIRTGPADYSERLVSTMKDAGMYRQQDGHVVHVASGERIAVPSEQQFFRLCGAPWKEPRDRA